MELNQLPPQHLPSLFIICGRLPLWNKVVLDIKYLIQWGVLMCSLESIKCSVSTRFFLPSAFTPESLIFYFRNRFWFNYFY